MPAAAEAGAEAAVGGVGEEVVESFIAQGI
jgi:hypothetical protein